MNSSHANMKTNYTVMITKTHWVDVVAESEDAAYDMAEDLIPSFSSEFEETEMEITETEVLE